MKSSGIVVFAVMALVAVGVYFGLQILVPHAQTEPALQTPAPVEPVVPVPAPVVAPPPAPVAAAPAPVEEVAVAKKVKPKPIKETPVNHAPSKAQPAPDHIAPWWPHPAQMPHRQLKLI